MKLLATLGFLILAATGCTVQERISYDDAAFADINGEPHLLLNPRDPVETVLIFITHDCPIANGYAPEINRIVADYSEKADGAVREGQGPIKFFLVHVERNLDVAKAQDHAKQYGYKCLVLLDPLHKLVKKVGATVTPEAAVLNRRGALVYRGRIDDRYVDFGKKRAEPARRDLREALDAVRAGRPVPNPRTKAIGCFIP